MPHHQTKPNAPDQAVPTDRHVPLPHDRDETAGDDADHAAGDARHEQNRQTMKQALADTESKIVDTERRGIPSDVPSSSANG